MTSQEIIRKTRVFVHSRLSGEATGHDYWHTMRVFTLAERIGRKEKADLFIVRLAALLHDIADWKFHGGDISEGPRQAEKWLNKLRVHPETIALVCDIIKNVSFKGAGVASAMKTIEGKVVQDADRLDALGAIGIARTFAYGGSKGRPLYDPLVKPKKHKTFTQYKKGAGPTINHFYEKLLLLKGRMNTRTGKKMARERHAFMQEYLRRFFREWGSA